MTRSRTRTRTASLPRTALGALLALAALLLAAPSALGLLYLLRQHGDLASGPLLRGALPLQQLAGGDAQPLLRVALAFGAAGVAGGVLLALATRARTLVLTLAATVVTFLLLLLSGAASDAVANSYRFVPQLAPQLLHGGLWAETALLAAGTIAGACGARLLRRPRAAESVPDAPGTARRAHAADLVAAHARDSLDPFALRDDKAFHFSDEGLVAYRVLGRTAVVGGDPIGPAGSAAETLGSFEREAAARGWKVVLTGVSPAGLAQLRDRGYRALQIGTEAIVDPRGFTLEGRRVRKLRQSVTRAERLGWQVDARWAGELSDADRDGIDGAEREWQARQPRLQGFAMTLGRLWGEPEDDDALFVLARDPHGEVAAFLRFARYRDGLSLDAMRRAAQAPNGLCEAMVAAALEHARDDGVTEVSLNFAGFGHVMAAPVAELPVRQRLLRWLLHRTGDRFQLERLTRFNAKFAPQSRPRYLLYRGRLALPAAGLRVLQAEAYLPAPGARRARPRTAPAAVGRPVSATHAARPVAGAAPTASVAGAPALLRRATTGPA